MYKSKYYTCEQIDERLLQGYVDDYNIKHSTSLTKDQFLTKLGSIFLKENVIDNTITQIGYYECDTAAVEAAKAITAAHYALFAGGSMKVKFVNKNTANNATLNINSQGAKALYYQGERASATNSWDAQEVVEIYYDGTNYYANNVAGGDKQIQSDWNQNDSSKKDFIKNKPTIPAPTIIDPQPTKDSPNAVSSGGVYDVTYGILKTRYIPFDLRGESIISLSDEDMTELFGPATMVGGQSMFDLTVGQYQHIYRVTNSKSEVFEIPAAYHNANGARKVVGINGNLTIELSFIITNGVYVNAAIAKRETSIPGISYEEEQDLTAEQRRIAQQNIGLDVVVKGDVQQSLSADQKVQAQNNMMGKAYNAAQFSGLGKKVLAKNVEEVGGVNKNYMTQDFFKSGNTLLTNTVFVIQYDYELKENVEIGAGCTLEFDGGSIRGNGPDKNTITGNNTTIIYKDKAIFKTSSASDAVHFSGSWICPQITTDMWASLNYTDSLQDVFALLNSNIHNTLVIGANGYNYNIAVNSEKWSLAIADNTDLILNGTIALVPNSYDNYEMIRISSCNNVSISGYGSIIGDRQQHDYTTVQSTHEYGFGLIIRASSNINISGITIRDCIGDAIAIMDSCHNIDIHDMTMSYCRRCAVSVHADDFINIYNCKFIGIQNDQYNDPVAAIDIEPTVPCTVHNIAINNCHFVDSVQGVRTPPYGQTYNTDYRFVNLEITNCYFKDSTYTAHIAAFGWEKLTIQGCVFNNGKQEDIRLGNALNAIIKDCKTSADSDNTDALGRKFITTYYNNKSITIDGCQGNYISEFMSLTNCELLNIRGNQFTTISSFRINNNGCCMVSDNDFTGLQIELTCSSSIICGNKLTQSDSNYYCMLYGSGNNIIKNNIIANVRGVTIDSGNDGTAFEGNICTCYPIVSNTEGAVNIKANNVSLTYNNITDKTQGYVIIVDANLSGTSVIGNMITEDGTAGRKFRTGSKVVLKDNQSNKGFGINAGASLCNFVSVNTPNRGTTADRLAISPDDGFQYYDETLQKWTLYNGSAWTNLDGTTLS